MRWCPHHDCLRSHGDYLVIGFGQQLEQGGSKGLVGRYCLPLLNGIDVHSPSFWKSVEAAYRLAKVKL
jgi:hypothetical protein